MSVGHASPVEEELRRKTFTPGAKCCQVKNVLLDVAMARVQDRCKLLRESDFEMMTACATRFEFVCLAEISFALVHSGCP